MGRRAIICQLCRNHRSAGRRVCIGCARAVGPGCWPEQCLSRQYSLTVGLCRECEEKVLMLAVQLLAKTPSCWLELVARSGF